jgi:hypothetical protein
VNTSVWLLNERENEQNEHGVNRGVAGMRRWACYWDGKGGESMKCANISDKGHADDAQEIIRRLLSLVRTAAQLIRLRSLPAAADHIERMADWNEDAAAAAGLKREGGG